MEFTPSTDEITPFALVGKMAPALKAGTVGVLSMPRPGTSVTSAFPKTTVARTVVENHLLRRLPKVEERAKREVRENGLDRDEKFKLT